MNFAHPQQNNIYHINQTNYKKENLIERNKRSKNSLYSDRKSPYKHTKKIVRDSSFYFLRTSQQELQKVLDPQNQLNINFQNLEIIDKNQIKSVDQIRLQTNQILEELDGIYQGTTDNQGKKDGIGIFLSDEGLMYMGEWHQDQLHGEGILCFPFGGYFYGNFSYGKAQGYGILKYPFSKLLAGTWYQGKLHGEVFQRNDQTQKWYLQQYQMGQRISDLFQENLDQNNRKFPTTIEMKDGLKEVFEIFYENNFFQNWKKNWVIMDIGYLRLEDGLDYLGFIKEGSPNGLGVIYFSKKYCLYGQFKRGLLHGLGRIILDNGDIYDGQFQGGEFQGEGIFYNKKNHQYIQGRFQKNQCSKVLVQGLGFPQQKASQMRKNLHLKNTNFIHKHTNLIKQDLVERYLEEIYLDYLKAFDDQNENLFNFISKNKSPEKNNINTQQQNYQNLEKSEKITKQKNQQFNLPISHILNNKETFKENFTQYQQNYQNSKNQINQQIGSYKNLSNSDYQSEENPKLNVYDENNLSVNSKNKKNYSPNSKNHKSPKVSSKNNLIQSPQKSNQLTTNIKQIFMNSNIISPRMDIVQLNLNNQQMHQKKFSPSPKNNSKKNKTYFFEENYVDSYLQSQKGKLNQNKISLPQQQKNQTQLNFSQYDNNFFGSKLEQSYFLNDQNSYLDTSKAIPLKQSLISQSTNQLKTQRSKIFEPLQQSQSGYLNKNQNIYQLSNQSKIGNQQKFIEDTLFDYEQKKENCCGI